MKLYCTNKAFYFVLKVILFTFATDSFTETNNTNMRKLVYSMLPMARSK
jgi:hypothetical protein